MDTVSICDLLRQTCVRIIIVDGDRKISFGTGALINATGTVITAKHVIASDKKLYPGNIYVQRSLEQTLNLYRCISDPGLELDTGAIETHPLPIDLAILVPSNGIENSMPHLKLASGIAPIGTEIVLAGFSDDIYMPLDFEESFDTRRLEGMDMEKEFSQKEPMLRQLLCKKGIIGSRWTLTIHGHSPSGTIESATYTLDTDISYGASGGPVVNMEGNLIGVVCKRGVADASRFRIGTPTGDLSKLPSGTSYALDHRLITCFLP